MRPLEAYEAVMRFSAERGEPTLHLALHAAVPQTFRPDLLHLIRLNFVPEAPHEAEADVLLAPFCEDIGGGYYQLDPEARRLLLVHLDPTYPEEKVSRVQRVADFLVTYIATQRRRLSADQDRLAEDYLSIQGWVALAFLQPEAAALQLAAALDQGTQGEIAARVQFSGLASALSVPLVQYPKLLTYAAGLEALEQGRTEDAVGLLERLPDEEIRIGGVTLRSPRRLLTKREGEMEQRTETASSAPYGSCFISYSASDREFVDWLRPALQSQGVQVWTAPDDLELGRDQNTSIREAIQFAHTFLLVLSRRFRSSRGAKFEAEVAQRAGRRIIGLLLAPPHEVFGSEAWMIPVIDFSRREDREKDLATLLQRLAMKPASSPEIIIPASDSWGWLESAGFDYHCYVSWDGRDNDPLLQDFGKRFIGGLRQSLANYLVEPKVFFDQQSLVQGEELNRRLEEALYRSIAMVALYTPSYERPDSRGGREWAVMERLSQERMSGERQSLIIPVVLRRSGELPKPMLRIQYHDISEAFQGRSPRMEPVYTAAEQVARRIVGIIEVLKARDVRVRSVPFKLPSRSAFATEPEPAPAEAEGGLIYLSYAQEDVPIAQTLLKEFERAGLKYATTLQLVDEAEQERHLRQIEMSAVFVALLSRQALREPPRYLQREWELAAASAHERGADAPILLPVLLEDDRKQAGLLPEIFYRTDWFNLQSYRDRQRLVEFVREIIQERQRSPAPP